ncbi:hypothetical protein [Daejeonella oryzae]|uniref:hypothetical protein n=1 Tax=Daejeonella oryzae TaxID=1122943 RepID=UPI00040BF841|nr:hypothetical protein [Daejeonella oryzae]
MKKLIIILSLLQFISLSGFGQTDTKEKLNQEIQSFRNEVFNAVEVYLNTQNDVTTRVSAISKYPFIYDPQQIVKVRSIVLNATANPILRSTGLSKLINQMPDDDELITSVFKWVEDKATAKELRFESLNTLKILSFSGFAMFTKNQQFLTTARNLTSDPDINFRRLAFDYLMAHGDSFAQGLLITQLDRGKSDLLPTVDILRLLALNPHGDFLPTVFKVFKSPPNKESKIEAMTILGNYLPAKDLIIAILKDKKQPNDMRLIAMGTLNSSYPAEFSKVTEKMLIDDTEAENLKVTAVYMEMYRRKSNQQRKSRLSPDTFDTNVKKLAESGKSINIKKAGKAYLESVEPKF